MHHPLVPANAHTHTLTSCDTRTCTYTNTYEVTVKDEQVGVAVSSYAKAVQCDNICPRAAASGKLPLVYTGNALLFKGTCILVQPKRGVHWHSTRNNQTNKVQSIFCWSTSIFVRHFSAQFPPKTQVCCRPAQTLVHYGVL